MANTAVLYTWTPANLDAIMETAPSSVTTSMYSQNPELQNCQNSVRYTVNFFCGRVIRSRTLILLICLIIYTLSGAFMFHLIESPAEIAKYNQTRKNIVEKRNELVDRIVAIRSGNKEKSKWANLTYAALLWYENEIGQQIGHNRPEKWSEQEGYWKNILLMGASVSTIGFQLDGPSTNAYGRLFFIILIIPGLLLYIASIASIGEMLYKFYNGIIPRGLCCRPARRLPESEPTEFLEDQLCWASLLPYFLALFVIALAEIALYHYCTSFSSDYVDSIYYVTRAIFSIGATASHFENGATWAHVLLLAFASVWLAHLACFWRAIMEEKEKFKRYLMAWMQKNKEDGMFVKLCLLQPVGSRPAIADTIMAKCTRSSPYKRLLFSMVSLGEKVIICRHLIWISEEDMAFARKTTTSAKENGSREAAVQVEL